MIKHIIEGDGLLLAGQIVAVLNHEVYLLDQVVNDEVGLFSARFISSLHPYVLIVQRLIRTHRGTVPLADVEKHLTTDIRLLQQ